MASSRNVSASEWKTIMSIFRALNGSTLIQVWILEDEFLKRSGMKASYLSTLRFNHPEIWRGYPSGIMKKSGNIRYKYIQYNWTAYEKLLEGPLDRFRSRKSTHHKEIFE
ncbi:MAG: hypothetical protein EOP56_15110 [Sphingobacteriales bacterium]|nr:MAG: hypothetical protein EOP56_15110 [Sphingobacteriales bacterium]